MKKVFKSFFLIFAILFFNIPAFTKSFTSDEELLEEFLSEGYECESYGDYSRALEVYEEALELCLKIKGEDSLETAGIYNSKGNVYYAWGDYEQALYLYKKALTIAEKKDKGQNEETVRSYINIGSVNLVQEKYDDSLNNYNNALSLCKKISGEESYLTASIYSNLSTLYVTKKDYNQAVKFADKALKLCTKIYGDYYPETAYAYNSLAYVYEAKEDYETAGKCYENALDILSDYYGDFHPDVADVYFNLGLLDYYSGDYKEACKSLSYAFEIYGECENYSNVLERAWIVFSEINDVPEKYEDDFFEMKLQALSSGINGVENARIAISDKKESIIAKALPLYYAAVDLYAQAGEEKLSFYYSELLRSRGFLEEIGTEAALKLDGITNQERNDFKKYTNEIQNLVKTISEEKKKGKNDKNSDRIAAYEKSLETAKKSLSKLEDTISSRIPKFYQLRNPEPVDYEAAKKWVGKNKAVLEYVLWDESFADTIYSTNYSGEISYSTKSIKENKSKINSYCLVITNKKVTPVKLDPDFNYTQAIEKFRNLITDKKEINDAEFISCRNELYQKLIDPVFMSLPLRPDNIMIVPDGNLSFIPFDVLCDEDNVYLGELYNLSISPSVSVSVLNSQIKGNKNGKVLALGNAVYDKSSRNNENRGIQMKFMKSSNKVSQEELLKQYAKPETAGKYYEARNINWSNIPGTGEEINNLKNKVFSKKQFQMIEGENVTESKLKELSASKTLSDYSVIHLACHGYFDTGNYQMSSIVFSEVSLPLEKRLETYNQDGYMTLSEASVLNLNAELVNLSACQTGLAQLQKGDGMTGLTRSFLVAGAKRVGVTLWSVDDEATCEFMTRMYSKVEKEGYTYSEAYAEVKSEFRKMDKWSSPYYWAAFVLYE